MNETGLERASHQIFSFLAQITGPQQSQKRRVSCSLAARATCCRFLATEALLAKLPCTVLALQAISISEIHTRDGKSDSDGALRALGRSAEALGMIDLCARAVAQLLNKSSCTIAQPVAVLLKRLGTCAAAVFLQGQFFLVGSVANVLPWLLLHISNNWYRDSTTMELCLCLCLSFASDWVNWVLVTKSTPISAP